MIISYSLVLLGIIALTAAQNNLPCSKQMELQEQCLFTVQSTPEARMLNDRKKQAVKACVPDYPQECYAQQDAVAECMKQLIQKAGSDPILKEAKAKSEAAIDQCFVDNPPDVMKGIKDIFGQMGQEDPGKMSHKGGSKDPSRSRGRGGVSSASKENATSSESKEQNSTNVSASVEKGKGSASASAEMGRGSSKKGHGTIGGTGEEKGNGGSHSKEGGISGSVSREMRAGSNSNENATSNEEKMSSSFSRENATSSSSSREERGNTSSVSKSRGKHSGSSSMQRGRGGNSSGSRERSGEKKKWKAGSKSGNESASNESHNNRSAMCRKTKAQLRCVKLEMQKLSKDRQFVEIMNTLIRQKEKCKTMVDWSCTLRGPRQQKCFFDATKPCRIAIEERMTNCLKSKGADMAPFSMGG